MKYELTSQKFGRYTVVSRDVRDNKKKSYWNVVCECGEKRQVSGWSLTKGEATSCGCFHKENQARLHTTHGGAYSPEYIIWENMVSRCTNSKNKHFKNYGGRGITLSTEWRNFQSFIDDMGERPHGFTLERMDNDSGYSKENCHWANRHDQARNRRSNHNITYNDVTMCLTDWAKSLGIAPCSLDKRLRKWTLEDALTRGTITGATYTAKRERTAI